ncbi:CD209 antigen-like protein E [Crotalus tigris]|uniref:CD209 antigen-like protein E n=1 Tax=Crotalus tigris TaxID=88082 RepID=UPI00192F6574|nr:CD209 antigen-like protein E [Crotalus tigris]
MAPKAPPKPPPKPPVKAGPKKPIFQRLGEFVDPDKAKRRTKILVFISFILAVIATYLYKAEVNRKEKHIKAVASIRQFAVDYDPSLEGKTDLEILAAVHLLTLELFNWTLKIEELEAELKILTKMLPEWQSFERNLYYFSSVKKSWSDARKDCQQRHAADLVTCRFGEEQIFIDEVANRNKRSYWIGLQKNTSGPRGLVWVDGHDADNHFWAPRQPSGGYKETCIHVASHCSVKHCWHDAPCSHATYFSCKMKPKKVWFY